MYDAPLAAPIAAGTPEADRDSDADSQAVDSDLQRQNVAAGTGLGDPRAGCTHIVPLPATTGVGCVSPSVSPALAPPLPATRQPVPLRTSLQNLGPDFLAGVCADVNCLHEIAAEAKADGNAALRFLATRAAMHEGHKLVELAHGRTLNINTTIKSQRDVPAWERLSPEDRARIDEVLNKLQPESNITDVDPIRDEPSHPTT